MSIFKESFKDFVRKQIKIREAIISHGNSAEESRTSSPKVDLTNLGGPKDLVLPSHAFYTNTTNRQCTIRMSSGVDLKSNNELIKDNDKLLIVAAKDLTFTPTTSDRALVASIEYQIIRIYVDENDNENIKYEIYLRA